MLEKNWFKIGQNHVFGGIFPPSDSIYRSYLFTMREWGEYISPRL